MKILEDTKTVCEGYWLGDATGWVGCEQRFETETAVLGGDKPTLLGGGGGGWDAMSSTMTDH